MLVGTVPDSSFGAVCYPSKEQLGKHSKSYQTLSLSLTQDQERRLTVSLL
jgi:hypothetical protein